jgi:hypothetical protein
LLVNVLEDGLQRLEVTVDIADNRLHAWLSPGQPRWVGDLHGSVRTAAADIPCERPMKKVYPCAGKGVKWRAGSAISPLRRARLLPSHAVQRLAETSPSRAARTE